MFAKLAGADEQPPNPQIVWLIDETVMVVGVVAPTVTVAAAACDLSAFDVAMMLVVPAALAVTTPVASTEATAEFDDDQVTVLSVTAGPALTAAMNVSLSPMAMVAAGGVTVTPWT